MRREDSSPLPRTPFEAAGFDYQFVGAAGDMDGVDGWAFDSHLGTDSLSRNGTGAVVGPPADATGAIAHALPPIDLTAAWSFSCVVNMPAAPFANLTIAVELLSTLTGGECGIVITGQADGSRPTIEIYTPTTDITGIVPNDPITGAVTFKLVYDGVNTLNLYQDGALLTSIFPANIAAGAAAFLAVTLQDDTDLPLASVSRVSVPGIP